MVKPRTGSHQGKPWVIEEPSDPCPRSQDPKDQGVTVTEELKSAQWTFAVPGAENFKMLKASNFIDSA